VTTEGEEEENIDHTKMKQRPKMATAVIFMQNPHGRFAWRPNRAIAISLYPTKKYYFEVSKSNEEIYTQISKTFRKKRAKIEMFDSKSKITGNRFKNHI
jgi:hypothetical protein